jgi:glycosyltransferase involved in cell wall biosynthesis
MSAYSLSPEKVRVFPYGINHNRFQPGATLDSDWARARGIREGYLLHVGIFSQRKNIPFLLRAVAKLRAKSRGIADQLVLAGSKSPGVTGAAQIDQTIKELHLADSVVLAGHVPDQHIPGLYAQAKVLVMPSLYEGFGFPVLESMAAGTPVVASNNSSLPEVAGDEALLVSPTDEHALAEALEAVLHNPKTAAELKTRGLARAKQFNWQRTAAETLEVYRSVVR